MKIKVEYTAHLKRAAGTAEEEIELRTDATLLDALDAVLKRHGGELRRHLQDAQGKIHPSLVIAVNGEQVFLESSRELSDGDAIVLLAAIAGG